MNIADFIVAKPTLIGIHLVFAIIGIDAFLWLLGEIVADTKSVRRRVIAALTGIIAFSGSWIVGGYYYVKFYGSLVKPLIKAGGAPWAHAVAMESKEHVFLFLIPLAITAFFMAKLASDSFNARRLKKLNAVLCASIAGLGLLIGLLGFIISAAVRWA